MEADEFEELRILVKEHGTEDNLEFLYRIQHFLQDSGWRVYPDEPDEIEPEGPDYE